MWVEAARPRTLPAAVAPVLVGTAAADRVIVWRFAAALVVALALQVGVNYANDYFDGVRGVDTAARVGPRRAVAAGLVPPQRMRVAMLAAFAVAALAGLALAVAVGWELLVVGLLAFLAALGYSGGPRPYASAGLGEVFVFVFFGLVATIGSTYVQIGALTASSALAGVCMGSLATAILVVNNLRDIETDAAAGKATLAVRLGEAGTRRLYRNLILYPFALAVWFPLADLSWWPLIVLLALPLALHTLRVTARASRPADLVAALVATARLELVFAVLLAAGLWLG